MRYALSELLSKHEDFEVCGEAADVDEALDCLKSLQPDIVLVDISLRSGHGSGIELIKQIKAECASVKTIALSLYEESLHGQSALRAGAMGYVNKKDSQYKLVEAIRDVLHGKMHFSAQISERGVSEGAQRANDIRQ